MMRYQTKTIGALALATILLAVSAASAVETRRFNRIATPSAPGGGPRALPGEALANVDRSALVAAIREALLTWNTPNADSVLDETFYDRERLLDNLRGGAPLDARIRILGVRAVNILGQRADELDDGRKVIVSTAVAVVDTQIEFEDPTLGFRQVRGLNEYHLDVTSLAPQQR
jgi:hypothetical protein